MTIKPFTKQNAFITVTEFDRPGSPACPSAISVRLQNGPIKENGVNGAQIDDLIQFCRDFIAFHNEAYPCSENSVALTKLDEAMMWLDARRKNREQRGVEGTSAA